MQSHNFVGEDNDIQVVLRKFRNQVSQGIDAVSSE
jgi:hypothetical protein